MTSEGDDREPQLEDGETADPNPHRRPARPAVEPKLHESIQGARPGDRAIRITRPGQQKLRRLGTGAFEATAQVLQPTTKLGRWSANLRRLLIGAPLATHEQAHERLSKLKALAVFSSDNLSSSAYATEEILLVLLLAGTASLSYSLPIALAIACLAAIVVASYVQLVRAYPGGGGAYAVTKENLGVAPSLAIGSTLFVDYVLTVAVSTAAGVAAITSAVPDLYPARIEIAVGFVALLTIGNLRGIRESGNLFAVPPYLFILSFGGMLVVGLVRLALGDDLQAEVQTRALEEGTQALTLFLLLRAFSSGAAALTGIEAIADGVPSFKAPEARNASVTLIWMGAILGSFFIGTTVLATQLDVIPSEERTVVAQIAATVFGDGALFYVVQVSTAMILVLAANTAFAGLPTLASVMARDQVMPTQFAFRGDRLAFSNGILVLGFMSGVVLILFSADTHRLIPLYAFGVFVAFTLSQAGMVVHWLRLRAPQWRLYLAMNALGMVVTGVVALIVGVTKFADGAWLSMTAMAVLGIALWRITRHYEESRRQLGVDSLDAEGLAELRRGTVAGGRNIVIVPVDQINRAVLRTVAYARMLSDEAIAVFVTDEDEVGEAFRRQWEETVPDVPLTIVKSPYRSLVEPLRVFIEGLERNQPDQGVTVVLPEFVVKRFWHHALHNQLSLRLKQALRDRPNTIIVEVPYHLGR